MRYLAVFTLLSFGVYGDLISEGLWSDYGDIQKRIFENYGVNYRWQGGRGLKNWFGGISDDKYYSDKGVSLGFDQRYELELRVNENEVIDEKNFIRPCALEDWQCIRKFFAHNSHCSPAFGPAPDPLFLARSTLLMPNSNLTFTLTNVKVTGLGSAKVQEFYANKLTGNLVFSILVLKLNETTPKSFITYRRTGKESIILADASGIEFDSLTFTAVIPKHKSGLRLDLADIHVDIHDGTPKYFVGPKAYTSKDPDVITGYASLVLNIKTSIKEALEFQARLFLALYIQQNVCDFGIKLYTL